MSCVIEPKENGPYLVKNLQSLSNSEGEKIKTDGEVVVLCRCGKSSNKPFCDGTHRKTGFLSATDSSGPGDWQNYVGNHITIHDNRRLCAHAGKCTDGLASVWRMNKKPWIDPDGADVAAIISVIDQCPSGALSYTIDDKPGIDDEPGNEQAGVESILVAKDGPYHVVGGITLNDPSRTTSDIPVRYALCRCGASKNKPFCDGSHWDIEFKDDVLENQI